MFFVYKTLLGRNEMRPIERKECQWGAVVQWLERATDNPVVAGSNPAQAVWKLLQYPLPHFASVFQERH